MTTEIRVPTLGESVTEATVATWFKTPGDSVALDEMLCELETDKVTVEVASSVAGTLAEIIAAEGSTVGVDALLALISNGTSAAAAASKPAPSATKTPAIQQPPASTGNLDVVVPTLGESVTEATVTSWFKVVGDAIVKDEMLCELETDKVSVEVPAPAAGILSEILVTEGSTVAANAKLAVLAGRVGAAAPTQVTALGEPKAKAAASADIEDAPSAKKPWPKPAFAGIW